MSESLSHLDKTETDKEVLTFIKKFTKLKSSEASELRKKLIDLNLIKINSTQISKIIDFLPEKTEDLNKVVPDANLDEDETKKIIDTIKEFK